MNNWCRLKKIISLKENGLIAKLLLAVVIGLVMLGPLPAPAQAQEQEPIDLVLGGEGATSWFVDDIKPCASGTEEVTLHNAGYLDGFVVIWISDIVSGEGKNPEPETNTTDEDGGELDNYLLLDLSTDPSGLITTNVSLPATINDLPQSVDDSNYIWIVPLNHEGADGDTVTLYWYWELPCETGNDAQGDTLSFSMTYFLREFGPGSIGDLLWADTDMDSEKDTGEAGIASISVALLNVPDRSLIAITETDANGYYLFPDLEAGDYIVDVDERDSDMPSDYFSTTHNDPKDVSLAAGEDYLDADFGFGPVSDGVIGDLVWDDANGNGAYDEGEVGIPFVTVFLYSENGVKLAETETDFFGNYYFFVNSAGIYPVKVDLTDSDLAGYTPTTSTTVEAVIASNFLDADFGFTSTTPSYGGGGVGRGGEVECYFLVDMLTEITVVEVDCCTNRAIGYYLAYDPDDKHFLEIKDGMEVICGECTGCHCYPKVIVMSPSEETVPQPDGNRVIVGPVYDFTGYKDLERTIPCKLATYFDPSLVIQIAYDPALLPPGAYEPAIGFFDKTQGMWVILPPDTGRIAEGVATGVTSYIASPFAVLVNVPPATNPQTPSSPAPAHFVVSDLNVTPSVREIWQPVTFVTKTGENVTITATVTNDGGQEGTYTAELKINGETIDSQEVTLDAGQSEQVSFTLSGMENGQYEVVVSGLSDEFTVSRTINWWLIGSIIAALTILIGWLVWYFWYRKKKIRPKLAS